MFELREPTRFSTFEIPKGIQKVSENEKEGVFELAPLEPGFGTTVGNAMRRVLLSSLEGYAISHIQIEGVPHEFFAIKGVKEDVVDIIQNLKEVRFKAPENENFTQETLFVTVKGKEQFTGADIDAATDKFEVINKDLVIANLSEGVELNLKLLVMQGRGFVLADEHERWDEPALDGSRVIPIDSKFTPIRKVSFNVENTRVGRKTDYEKLTLTVVTDGTISPSQAIEEAASILIHHFKLFTSGVLKQLKTPKREELPESAQYGEDFWKMRRLLQTPLQDLDISVRAYNCLRSASIKTLGDLVKFNMNDLLKFRNFGKKSLEQLDELLKQRGLSFGMDVSSYHLDKTDEEIRKLTS